eukprot:766865-Hanusia_phi.AAC.8
MVCQTSFSGHLALAVAWSRGSRRAISADTSQEDEQGMVVSYVLPSGESMTSTDQENPCAVRARLPTRLPVSRICIYSSPSDVVAVARRFLHARFEVGVLEVFVVHLQLLPAQRDDGSDRC